MPSGTGYIYEWVIDDVGGLIHVCGGDRLVGDDVAFPIDECASDLKAILKGKNINDEADCPPPGSALKVAFDFDLLNGMDLAVNVRRV